MPFHFPHGWEDPTTWTLVALALFVGLLVWLKVPQQMMAALDARAKTISDELDAAQRLRDEAAELLAGYQRRQREAEHEAQAIVDQARREAERAAVEAEARLAEQLQRRSEMADRKIAAAEADAERRVRAAAAELAVEAARIVLAGKTDAKSRDAAFNASVDAVEKAFG